MAAGGDFVGLVVDYAKQETLGPVRGLGRFVAFGAVGSMAVSAGLSLLLLALLRLLQTETGSFGRHTWAPYLVTAAAALVVLGLAAWRITKGPARRSAPGRREGRR